MKTETAIRNYFKNKTAVAAVYLFGSAVKKEKKPQDIDIAVLYRQELIPNMQPHLEMKEELCSLLEKECDLIVMNQANPILKHQIFQKGKLLVDNDHSFLSRFLVHSLMEYDDIKRMRAPIEKAILKGRIYGR